MIARPCLANALALSQIRSRTRAEMCPTNTPGAISSSQRVRSPLNPVGHAVRTITVIFAHFYDKLIGFQGILNSRRHLAFFVVP